MGTQVGDPRGDQTAYHLALAEELAKDLVSAAREAALERFERGRAGLDDALARFVDRDEADGAVRMLRALRDVWWGSGRLREARRWGEAVLAMPAVRADDAVRATVLDFAGAVAFGQEGHAVARRHFEDSLRLRRSLGDPPRVAQSLHHLCGVIRWGLGDPHTARPLMREALERAREAGHAHLTGAALLGLGTLAVALGRHEDARAHLTEGLAVFLAEHARAAAADAQHERLATSRTGHVRAWGERHLAAARASLAESVADAEWAHGRAMTLDDAVAYATDSDANQPRAAP